MVEYVPIVLINLFFPTLLISMGLALKKTKAEYPETEVMTRRRTNGIRLGYRTPTSISSREAWDYAQIIAPLMFIKYAKILYIIEIILSFIIVIFKVENDYLKWSGYGLGITFLILSVLLTDRNIENKIKN